MNLGIIANPVSGRGRARRLVESIAALSPARGVEVEVAFTRERGDAVRLARELSCRVHAIAIVGGDGTVHESINGLMPEPVPVVVLPAGNGNDYASLFGSARSPEEVLSMIAAGTGARLDVLDFGDVYCVNSAGLGFEGLVNKHSHGKRFIKGLPLYLAAVFKAISSLSCPFFRLTTGEGRTIEGERLLVSIGNGNRTGGGFYLTPDARPDDGLIDVCLVDPMSRLRVLKLLPASLNGSHVRKPEVRMLRTESLLIETSGGPMHVDGELVEAAPRRLEITVKPRVLPVLCRESPRSRLQQALTKVL